MCDEMFQPIHVDSADRRTSGERSVTGRTIRRTSSATEYGQAATARHDRRSLRGNCPRRQHGPYCRQVDSAPGF